MNSSNPETQSGGWKRVRAAFGNRRSVLTFVGLAVVALIAATAGAAVAAWTRACAGGCPTVAQIQSFAPKEASEVYDAEGELLGLFYRERRRVISIDSLPPHVPLAFVAIEDRRFFEHDGVDLRRFAGSVVDNLVNGFGASGFSTITMQLPRNLFPEQVPRGETTIRRKLAEVRIARQMERRFSKQEILELYLNSINLGAGAHGIEAAARTYFDKPAKELTPAEAALLAGIPKAPTHYNPRRNPEAARERRNLVLQAMAETGVITPAEAADAKARRLSLAPPSGVLRAPYFVEHVRRELEERFGELLYTGGLRIYTTLDPELQETSEQALEEQLRKIEEGAYGYFPHPTYEEFTESRAEGAGEVERTPYLQGVVAVLEPGTGNVRALVGGRDFQHSQFNRATQALRQPGSAFKPFVYGAALEQGLSPLYRVADAPVMIPQSDGSTWTPRNYSGDYEGMMTLREGLKKSKNMVAIRVGRQAGVNAVQSLAKRAGIETPIPDYPSVFIGAAAVYPLELVSAYAALGNGGVRVEPHFIQRIEDRAGELLWEPPRHPTPTIDPAVSWILTDMMREVVDHGTAYNVRNPRVGNLSYDIPAAGKTGTTNDATDVWFVGYTPDLVAGVWMGMDDPQTITRRATGGGLAAPVWAQVMRSYYEGREPPAEWERPSGVVTRYVSRWTGQAVAANCPYAAGAYPDVFAASVVPEPGCEPPEVWADPQPHLPGRPVFPGRPQRPRTEDRMDEYMDEMRRRRSGDRGNPLDGI